MNLVIDIINKNIDKYSDFEYYKLHLKKINDNKLSNPDISIETCKSLIEGISKSILVRLDPTFDEKSATGGRNPKSVQQLFKLALEKIAKYNSEFEEAFIYSSGQIINIISSIRTERGDISHGKSVPKNIKSTPQFATLLANVTDHIVSYVLSSFFEIEISKKLDYDFLNGYNKWLNDSIDFPIKKASYSLLLYENDYDEYETRYFDEYLPSLDPELKLGISSVIQILQSRLEVDKKSKNSQIKFDFQEAPKIINQNKKEDLVNTFDEKVFWSKIKLEKLSHFANLNKFELDSLKNLINDYLAFEVEPLRDDIRKIMLESLSLSDRKTVLPELLKEVVKFAEELKN